jgi:hypothetical protein
MSSERQPTRVGLTIGSTRRLNEFDFSKISLSLDRDLVPAENPIDAYRDIKALLERMVTEFQASKPVARVPQELKESLLQADNHALPPSPAGKAIVESRRVESSNGPVPPRPPVSKLAALQERLGPRLQNLEVTDGMGELIIKPRKYLGDAWAQINEVVRSEGGRWFKGETPKDGSWRIAK